MTIIKKITGLFGMVAGLAGLAFVAMLGLAGSASAQTVDPVGAAFDDMESKVVQYGGAFIALVVIATGLALGIRWLRKAKSA